ncbi:MAG: hypothetical protein QX189_04615 [Methylococcales bacterium]
MNELRLKEFIEQAMVEVPHEMGGTYMAFSKEKFADLIVQAALNEVRQLWYDANNAEYDKSDPRAIGIRTGRKQGALLANAAIKEHFGVE